MADKTITALTGASTPLAGTEVLPIVQSGATVKVAVSDLTAGRAVAATALTMSTGSLVPSTAGQGVNFTANTPAAGMTSQLLNWYEQGTWAPTVTPSAGTLTAYSSNGTYARAGRIVTLRWTFTVTTAGTASGTAMISNAPFTCASGGNVLSCTGIVLETGATGVSYLCFIQPNVTNIKIQTLLTNTGIVWINSYVYEGSITYQAA